MPNPHPAPQNAYPQRRWIDRLTARPLRSREDAVSLPIHRCQYRPRRGACRLDAGAGARV
jgi:hypothetical protein